jgi:hypothetical protein
MCIEMTGVVVSSLSMADCNSLRPGVVLWLSKSVCMYIEMTGVVVSICSMADCNSLLPGVVLWLSKSDNESSLINYLLWRTVPPQVSASRPLSEVRRQQLG